jgi:hypothetical protein
MNTKSFLIAGALMLASLGIVSAKSYSFSLSSPAMAGTTQLKAGEYTVKVEGANAIFTTSNSKQITVPVKIQHNGQKYDQTAVEVQNKDGVDTIHEIMLGGSDTKVELGE